MVDFNLQVLGANSAVPMPGRISSCFVLNYDHRPILIDCGEGAQIKMKQYNVKRSKLDHIFISHLHGDHIFGLPGLLGSLGLDNRKRPLHIYSPKGIKEFADASLKATQYKSSYDIIYHECNGRESHDLGLINGLKVNAFPLMHRIPTLGYKFCETKSDFNIKPSAISTYHLTIDEIKSIKQGQSVTRKGEELPRHLFIQPHLKDRSFAYCSDTMYHEELVEHIKNIDLLYHEATYLHDLVDKAHDRMHTTAHEAAMLALKANAGQLLIGHYSSRYKDLNPLLEEARSVFENTEIAEEGKILSVG